MTQNMEISRLSIANLVEQLEKNLPGEVTVEIAQDAKIEALMKSFDPTLDETWKAFAFVDENVRYTRNLVASGADYDLILLVWNPKKESPIHDHSCNCWMRIIQGSLTESKYQVQEGVLNPNPSEVTKLELGFCAYINDSIGLHKIANETEELSISLHLYCPRQASCNVYCPQSLQKQRRNMCYYSMFGEKVETGL
eukprot:c12707_g1_i1.p1 GENE.c12707_g1_i1~~c12707_g1_i1.p1  ORF type:complete len:196 (+),score=55.38 c12707_g1_i1:100-687(+)